MVSCRKAVTQAPSLGRFDVLLLSFEVEKCGLCFLFVGEKYGEIDKKLMCVCACLSMAEYVCVRACVWVYECVDQIKTECLSAGESSSWKKKWDVFFGSPQTPSLLLHLLFHLLQTPPVIYIGTEPAYSEVSCWMGQGTLNYSGCCAAR